jgi:DNA-binding transcriptional ArsR family regulator
MSYTKHRLTRPQTTPLPRSAQRLRRGAFTLSVVSHPVRLRIVFRLAEGARDTSQLAEDLGVHATSMPGYLDELRRGGLVRTQHQGKQRVYDLTEVGFKTVRFLRDTFGAIEWSEPLPRSVETTIVPSNEADPRHDDAFVPARRLHANDQDPTHPDPRRSHEPI